MAYYPSFYPNSYMQQYQQPTYPQQQSQQNLLWVRGEKGAWDYLVAPNTAVALWDETAPVIYLKQADASGRPSVKTYDLVERISKPVETTSTPTSYATQDDLNALAARVAALEPKKEDTDDE